MLKWLKQKPTIGQGTMSTEKITDDPLATIQVHPNIKKSKNKSNEIYAVSRVNPLFEEEDAKGVFSRGNNSGSSGYDSGPSDDDTPGTPKLKLQLTTGSISEEDASADASEGQASSRGGSKATSPPQLFRNGDNDELVLHHEAALVGPNGQPVLRILQQNPSFVKSIQVAVQPARRPLSPIAETRNNSSNNGSGVGSRVNAIRIPQRSVHDSVTGDSTGVGKMIQKDTRYVQSIRIGPSSGLRGQQGHFLPSSSGSGGGDKSKKTALGRKPSVTFSERVDVLVEGKLNLPRRISGDHDSIVTDSLLLMTSKDQPFDHMNLDTVNTRRVSLLTDFNNRRMARANNGNGTGTTVYRMGSSTSSSETELSAEDSKESSDVDLQAFASSMQKSHPVMQMVSSSELHPSDHPKGSEDPILVSSSSSSSRRERDREYDEDGDHDNDERSESSSASASQQESPERRPRTPRSVVNGRSPFGGIADHYAAAKEIAKEIESYSVGTTKSTKRSLVRDLLLSSRGRGGSSSSNSNGANQPSQDLQISVHPVDGQLSLVVAGKFQPSGSSSSGYNNSKYGNHQHQPHLIQQHHHHSSQQQQQQQQQHQSPHQMNQQQQPRKPWELVRVQQVYVKANSTQLSTSPQNEGQDHIQSNSQQVPIYDALPRAISRSHHDDSDSGNSSDRSPGEVRLEMGKDEDGEPHLVLAQSNPQNNYLKPPHSSSSSASSSDESRQSSSGNSSASSSNINNSNNNSKVMLVSGDSQNMVVDLSAVPTDLRDAILAGTALITLPDGVKKRLEPGYTMIAMPSPNSSSSNSTPGSNNSPNNLKEDQIIRLSDSSNNSSSHNSGSEDSPLANSKFGTKNKAQIWNVIQSNHISATLTSIGGKKGFRGGKDKKITTVLPFHPNQDSNTSPDFTIEGHRLRMQNKKLQVGKQRRCWCRLCGMLFFLVAFLGILVALSMIYTRGQRNTPLLNRMTNYEADCV